MNEEQIRNKLSKEEYKVLRERGTEAPFSGKFYDHKENGMYTCKVCGVELFDSNTKFDSGSGWPSFYDIAKSENVELHEDSTHGMIRTEVTCANCKSHLGHVFPDGPQDKTGKRYCINSVCLNFKKKN